jgi:hypothetical protein
VYSSARQRLGAAQRVGTIREELRHHLGRLEIALGVAREPAARGVHRRVVVHAREHVEERPLARASRSARRWWPTTARERLGEVRERDGVGLLVAQEVALQIDADVGRRPKSPISRSSRPPTPKCCASSSGRPGERDEAGGEAVELVDRRARRRPFSARIFMRVTRRQRFL